MLIAQHVNFNSTKSTQLSTNFSIEHDEQCGFGNYPVMWYGYDISGYNTLQKLDNISISNNNNLIKEFEFGYNFSPSQRLELASLKEKTNSSFNNEHKFFYKTSQALPAYANRKKDHWGYFNNNDFFENPPVFNYANLLNYSVSRDPNENYANAEIIDKIVYPTGGEIRFEFEPHDFSKKKNPTDFAIVNIGSNNEAGGIRIKKISYYTEGVHLEHEKVYEYTIPGSGSISSGLLSQPPASYLSGNSQFWTFQAVGFTSTFAEGNHVTYTYVTEKQTGKGKVQNTYSNYDNGFNDSPPIESNLVGITALSYAYNNKLFKRGKLLNSKIIDENSFTLEDNQYNYLHSEDESNKDELRNLHLDDFNSSNYPPNYASVSNRIYGDVLIETTKNYFTTTSNSSTTNSITYDLHGNVKESKSTDSKGNVFRKRFKYAYEYLTTGTDLPSLGINNLITKSCKNFLIEEIDTKENPGGTNVVVVSAIVYIYKSQSTFVDKIFKLQTATPIAFSSFTQSIVQGNSFIKDANYSSEPEIIYDLYDAKGNLLQSTSKAGITECKIWGYNNIYPVATITGTDYNTAYSFVSAYQSTIQNPANDQELSDVLDNIRSGLVGTNALVTTYTYSPLVGVTRITDSNNHTSYYVYDEFGRVSKVLDEKQNIIKTYEYHFKN